MSVREELEYKEKRAADMHRVLGSHCPGKRGKGWAEYISDAEVLQRALDTYGSALQIVVMMEEMSELQKELCKYLRGKYSPANIAEEIADVEIMLEQMKMLFCCADDVRNERRRKVERLKERLDNGDKESV